MAGHHEFTVWPPNDAHAAHSARQPEQQRRRDTRDKNIKIYEGGHGREESFPHASFDSGVKNPNSPGNVSAAVLLVPRREQKVTSTRSSVPCRLTPRDKHVRMGSKWLCSQQQNGTTAPRQRDHERRKGENHAIVPRREVPTSAMNDQ